MKKVFVQLLLSILSSAVASQLEWVDEQIEAIKPSRNGIEILKIEDPFLFLQKKKRIFSANAKHSLDSD